MKGCDNLGCEPDSEGRLCSGHGRCVCGECQCDEPWTGSACDCKEDPFACFNPSDDDEGSAAVFGPDGKRLPCSGRGECVCGRCNCTDFRYSGDYCQTCETCESVCTRLRPCVECHAFGQPIKLEDGDGEADPSDDCEAHCQFDYRERTPDEVPDKWENCTFWRGNCNYTFSYSSRSASGRDPVFVVLHVYPEEPVDSPDRRLRCPPPVDYFPLFFGMVGAIVCLGLLTLFLWKAFTTIHDRREFARFEQERQNVRFPSHSNPIFKQATTTVYNPTFNSQQHY